MVNSPLGVAVNWWLERGVEDAGLGAVSALHLASGATYGQRYGRITLRFIGPAARLRRVAATRPRPRTPPRSRRVRARTVRAGSSALRVDFDRAPLHDGFDSVPAGRKDLKVGSPRPITLAAGLRSCAVHTDPLATDARDEHRTHVRSGVFSEAHGGRPASAQRLDRRRLMERDPDSREACGTACAARRRRGA
jgi:hypothetical protein